MYITMKRNAMFFGHINSKNVNSGDFWIFMMLLNTEKIKCNKKYASQTCEIKHSNSYISSKVHTVSIENYEILARSQSRVRVAYKNCLSLTWCRNVHSRDFSAPPR